jgi:hypothetical protein
MDPLAQEALVQMLGSSPLAALVVGFFAWSRWSSSEPERKCPLVTAEIGPAEVGATIERVGRSLAGIESSLAGIEANLAELRRDHDGTG